MRRFAFFIAALAPLVAFTTGCEDGPNQPYSPAPAGAGNIWNGNTGAGGINADGGTYVGTGTEGYDASFGGTNANDLCTAPQQKAIWNKMFTMPILPPGLGGGLDIAGGVKGDGSANYDPTKPFTYDPTKETWTGATVEQAEAILCQGIADSIYFGVTNTLGWGENCPSCELSIEYNTNSRQATDLLFQYGYLGTINATSTDKKTSYAIAVNNQPISMTTSSGTVQLLINWTSEQTLNQQVNALWDALRNTYAPTFPADTDCVAAGHCIVGNNLAAGGYFWFTPINLAMYVSTTVGSAQADSIFSLMDLGLVKLLPFSTAGTTLKLDPEGPVALTPNVGGTGKACKYTLGMNFGDFNANCVQPFAAGDPNNTINENKLFGAMAHGDENYTFDIVGVDPQFAASSLAPTAVVTDAQRPAATDIAYEYTIDQEVLGRIANDYLNMDVTQAKDWHGNGLLTLEWANLVQQYMKAAYGVTADLGDPACIANPASPGVKGKVCSGIEGIVTTAATSAVPKGSPMLMNALGPAGVQVDPTLQVGLKPGTWYSVFCADNGGLDAKGNPVGYQNCFGGVHGGYFFDTMETAVGAAFPTTPATLLPSRRFYFQEWILALVKYMQSATVNNGYPTLAQIDANPVDANNLFFDSNGGGFETGNYVFRQYVNSNSQPPTNLNITTNLTTSVINDFSFTRYNFRGEKAIYQVLATNQTDKPGAEPVFISNVVGSPVLQNVYGSYTCAINTDPTNAACGGVVAPADPFGVPLFKPYQPAFGQSALHVAANGQPPTNAPLKVDGTDYTLIESAMGTLPIWPNPYDPTTAKPNDQTVSELLPFLPKGSNVGFPVTIDGSRDKFYNTAQIDFTGATVNGLVDFENIQAVQADGGINNETVVRAIETQNYLGLVFACAETNPVTKMPDVLAVRMYANAADILNWIAKYPTSPSDCGIEIKYSIYGNYADYISFLTNGVRLGLNPGFGGSVVTDVVLFDPNVVASLGQ